MDTFAKSQQPTQEFNNEHVNVLVERNPGCKVKFTIKTLPLATKAARAAAVRNVSKEVNIPGFRKGKAPQNIVEDRYGKFVDKEYKEIIARNALNEAMKLTSVFPFSKEAEVILIRNEKSGNDEQTVELEFDTFPDVPKVDPSVLKIEKTSPETVSDTKVEDKILELRLHHGKWEKVDREAKEGDYVVLDIDVVDDEKAPFRVHEDSRFYIQEGKMPLWARKVVLGLKAGESGTAFSEPESDENQKEYKPKKCLITVKEVQEVKLADLDDDLAKKAGVNDTTALREAIFKSLEKEADHIAKRKMRQAIKEKLLASYPFELPASRMKKLHQECHEMADKEASSLSHDQRHDYAHKLFSQAEETARLSYILPQIAKFEKIPMPTAHEIQTRAREHYVMHIMQGGGGQLGEDEIRYLTQVSENEIFTEKVLDYLIEKATV